VAAASAQRGSARHAVDPVRSVEMQDGSSRPYREAGREPLDYRGPGREIDAPAVDEVVLGWFGPADPEDPGDGEAWRGALLALDELNRHGRHAGRPFRLVPAWSASPWAAGIVEVTRLVYEDEVWALLGATSGASAHLAEQVALKARVSLVSSGSTDATASRGSVPWFFACVPSDARQAPALVDALAAASGGGGFVVAAAAEHDSHAALVEIRRELTTRGLAPTALVEFDPKGPDAIALARRLLDTNPAAVMLVAPALPAGRLVFALREAGFRGALIGTAPLARRAFSRTAGATADGVVVPRLWAPSARWDAFVGRYRDRWGEGPDYVAAWSYDALRLAADAVGRAGLNRARIRDALWTLAPWPGATGEVRWDALLRNDAPVGLARWRGGRLEPLPAGVRGDAAAGRTSRGHGSSVDTPTRRP
jgi:branched-chain amino acid transport system substrate-binding protein